MTCKSGASAAADAQRYADTGTHDDLLASYGDGPLAGTAMSA